MAVAEIAIPRTVTSEAEIVVDEYELSDRQHLFEMLSHAYAGRTGRNVFCPASDEPFVAEWCDVNAYRVYMRSDDEHLVVCRRDNHRRICTVGRKA